MKAYRPVKAIIDLSALPKNLQVVRRYAPNAKVLAIIKSNGYGHGIERVAAQLAKADGFGVACIDEAILLRQKGFLHRIVLLEGLFSEAELSLAIQHRFDFVIHSRLQLDWLIAANTSASLNIWLKMDTGMHRLGFFPKEIPHILTQLKSINADAPYCCMSHFASADESNNQSDDFTQQQLALFLKLTDKEAATKSLANSAGIQRFPESHFDWVRPGIMLYGASAAHERVAGLHPVMTLMSEVIALKWLDAGETVGYGQTWQAPHKTLIAVVAIGYGDGYPRHAPSGTPVLIHGQQVPLVGRVSMDMITVDVTLLSNQMSIGDEVILWGKGLSVDVIAQACGTIGYELLCGVTQRVPRIEAS